MAEGERELKGWETEWEGEQSPLQLGTLVTCDPLCREREGGMGGVGEGHCELYH